MLRNLRLRNALRALLVAALCLPAGAGYGQKAGAPTVRVVWKGADTVRLADGGRARRLAVKGMPNDAAEGGNPVWQIQHDGALAAYGLGQALYRPLSGAEKALVDTSFAARPQVAITNASVLHTMQAWVQVRLLRRNPATHRLERLMAFTPQPVALDAPNPTARTGEAETDSTLVAKLASGNWGRVGVTQTGVYKIGAEELRRLGLDPATTDPRNLHVYGRGQMIPEAVGAASPGLHELAVWVPGQDDGRLDAGEALYFYGQGPVTWSYSAAAGAFQHSTHLYADTIQYIVGADATPGLRVAAAPAGAASTVITDYQALSVYEKEAINLLKLGRRWFSETFDLSPTKNYSFLTPGMVAGSAAQVRFAGAARSVGGERSNGPATRFNVSVGGALVKTGAVGGVTASPFYANYDTGDLTGGFTSPGGESLVVQVAYDKTANADAKGYVDFVELAVRQDPAWRQRNFAAWLPEMATLPEAALALPGLPASAQVWSVRDGERPQSLALVNGQAQVGGGAAALYVFAPELATAPLLLGHLGTAALAAAPAPDLLILTAPSLLTQAQAYADYRARQSGISVLVATTAQVYTEFTGGHQDIAGLRDFIGTLYNQGGSRLKYVLLFGDCSFDYKHRIDNNTNLVPIWENPYWQGPVSGWATDDFLAVQTPGAVMGRAMSVAIGRLPVSTPEEAEAMLAKVKGYETDTAALGSWRNVNMFAADNIDDELRLGFTKDANEVADSAELQGKAYLPSKFFLAAYPLVAGPGGQASPEIRSAIQRRLRLGALAVNYTGHGSEFQWADERIFDQESISTLDNGPRLPFYITATCEYGRLDEPSLVSGAEKLVLKPDGGAIGLLSACRPVYASTNKALHLSFYRHFYTRIAGRMPTMGEVVMRAKNADPGTNRPYNLFGDPSLTLAYPKHEVALTGMTDGAGRQTDTLRALQTVRLTGVVRSRDGVLLNSYKGTVQVTLYDKAALVTVRGITSHGEDVQTSFSQRKSVIFNGFTRVDSGRWVLEFQLPLDINYVVGEGLMSFYAKPDQGLEDGNGVNTAAFYIGGSAPFVADDEPPRVQLFMNDFSFVDGGIVGPDPTFLARVSDNTGINVSLSGIGHAMTGTFSYEPATPVVMNEFYTSDLGRPNQGTVRFPLQGLAPGSYKVYFKAWDLQNNSATDSLTFTVGEADGCPRISRPLVSPNPVSDRGTFYFDIDQPGKPLQVEVLVFDALGRRVGRTAVDYAASPARAGQGLDWTNGPPAGQNMQNGVYFYRILTSTPDGCQAVLNGRMVINR